jgi:hypothetical protein
LGFEFIKDFVVWGCQDLLSNTVSYVINHSYPENNLVQVAKGEIQS